MGFNSGFKVLTLSITV